MNWPSSWRAERVYCGHVLEHMAWSAVPEFLRQLRQLCAADAELMVVGPDVWRVLEGWKQGIYDDTLVQQTIEDHEHYQDADAEWTEARHHWNCYAKRVADVLSEAGWVDVEVLPGMSSVEIDWPVVSRVEWQCAVSARAWANHD